MSSPDLRVRINEEGARKVNITSSLDVNPEETKFVIITRQRAENTSKFIFRLELYNLKTLNHIKSVQIFQAYDDKKNYVKFLHYGNIVVLTKYHIIFYDNSLKILHKQLHEQIYVYDLCVSPDGKYAAVVAQNKILMWDTRTFSNQYFPQNINYIRKCDFSNDGKYLAICRDNQIFVYTFSHINGTLTYTKISQRTTASQPNYGKISSIDYNPYDSDEMVVGFDSISPKILKFNNKTFQSISNREQPFYSLNFKQAIFLPDGKRVISSDYMKGVSLFPGNNRTSLYYKENFLLFGLRPFDNGRRLIGFVWQNVKVINLQVQCSENATFTLQCGCKKQKQYYSYSNNACVDCPTINCSCPKGQKFSAILGKCVLKCQQFPHTIKNKIPSLSCICEDGYYWNQTAKRCIFSCSQFQFTNTASVTQEGKCECNFGLLWSSKTKSCVCPDRYRILYSLDTNQPTCVCAEGLIEQNGKCIAQCYNRTNTINSYLEEKNKCECEPNYEFNAMQNVNTGSIEYSCRYNCSSLKNQFSTSKFNGECECGEIFDWRDKKCQINCSLVINSDPQIQATSNCTCLTNYEWVPQINECGRICTNVKYVNRDKHSTAIKCPCIDNFEWNELNNKCDLNCQNIDYAEIKSPKNQTMCICQYNFQWDENSHACVINCSNIWDAQSRVQNKIDVCKCKGQKKFNQKKECELEVVSQYPIWIWIVLGIGLFFVLIVAIVMIKSYCCKFSTGKNNKQHNKKLKKTMDPPKRRIPKKKEGGSSTQRMKLNS